MIEQEELLSNPFPGLRAFEMDENYLFFGRDGQSNEVLSKLRASHFVAVVGTSGSGKSSLVRAGVLPALFSGHMTSAGSSWRIALFRPGNSPIGNLAKELNKPEVLGTGDAEDAGILLANIETTLRRSSLGLIEVVNQARMAAHENLLIVVDQFEELFRFKQNSTAEHPEDEAAAFVRLLLESTRQKELPIYIVLTMRSDYLGECAHFWGLPEAINEGQYLIPRMTDDGRREAVTGPVIIGGGKISAPLVNRLLNDAGDNPAQLPILQHALMRTWDYWKEFGKTSEPIDIPHYEAIGGMARALSRHADEAYDTLPEPLKKVAESVFQCLTEKGTDNREVRRPSTVREICEVSGASEAAVMEVIEVFRREGRSFLMPPPVVPLTADTLIDISHESLIRGWQRLQNWVDAEAESANTYRRLAETAVLYEKGKAGLWRDPDLQHALIWRQKNMPNPAWAQRYHPEYEKAIVYLEASKAGQEAEMAAIEQRRNEEIRKELEHAQTLASEQQRHAKLRNVGLVVLLVAFLLAGSLAVFARGQWLIVEDKIKEVEAQKKEVEAQKIIIERERDTARKRTLEAEEAKKDAVKQRDIATAALTETKQERDRARKAEKEADSQRVAAQRERREAESQRDVARKATAFAEEQQGVAETALINVKTERDKAATAEAKAVKAQEDAEREAKRATEALETVTEIDSSAPYFKAIMRGHNVDVSRAVISPDANLVATADGMGEARVWKVGATEKPLFEAGGGRYQRVEGINFSHSGRLIVVPYANEAGHVADIKDVSTGKTVVEVRQPNFDEGGGRADYAAFSPNDQLIATYHFSANDVFIWDANTGKRVGMLSAQLGRINTVAFSPDSGYLAAASSDGTAQVWQVATSKPVAPLRGHLSEVNSANFSHDGKSVVTASDDGTSHVWDTLSGELLLQLPGHEGEVNSAVFSHDDKYIITTSKNHALLWETKTPGVWKKDSLTPNSPTILNGHTDDVSNAIFSPDSRLIVTISDDRTARVWRAQTVPDNAPPVASLAVLRGHIKEVTSVDFGKDSTYVVTGSDDRTARVWDLTGLSAFRVATAELKAEPSEYTGKCPATVKFTGTISVAGGGGTVKYKFIGSKGEQSRVQEEVFEAPGTKQVSTTRTLSADVDRGGNPLDSISGWQAIQILEPVAMKSNEAAFTVRCEEPGGTQMPSLELTDAQLKQIMPASPPEKRALYLPHLLRAMNEFDINTPLRQAAFLAHVADNTADLQFLEELGTDDVLERRYGMRKDLGNYERGDGARYKGRGAFQITGRTNYQALSEPLGIDLVAYPAQAAAPEVAFRTAGFYWLRNGLNEMADKSDFKGITRRIRGGTTTLPLLESYKRAATALGATVSPQQ